MQSNTVNTPYIATQTSGFRLEGRPPCPKYDEMARAVAAFDKTNFNKQKVAMKVAWFGPRAVRTYEYPPPWDLYRAESSVIDPANIQKNIAENKTAAREEKNPPLRDNCQPKKSPPRAEPTPTAQITHIPTFFSFAPPPSFSLSSCLSSCLSVLVVVVVVGSLPLISVVLGLRSKDRG